MTLTIELSSDIEAGLLAQARAEGLAVSDFVQHLVEEQLATRRAAASGTPPAYELPPEEWVRKFNAWTQSHAALNLPVLSDEAISREFIYRERGL